MSYDKSSVNPESVVPMYLQIVNILRGKIESGELKPGDKLPSENELTKEYNVSRITIRSAISELEQSGNIVRSRGKGTFVASSKVEQLTQEQIGFFSSCQKEKKSIKIDVLECRWTYPTFDDVKFFNIEEDRAIIYTKRLLYAGGRPAVIETNYYSDKFSFLEEEELDQPFDELFHKKKIAFEKSERFCEVIKSNSQESSLLNIAKGEAVLLLTEKRYDTEGSPMYVSRQVFCTERLRLHI